MYFFKCKQRAIVQQEKTTTTGPVMWTRDQIVTIHRIMQKARELQKNIYFCFIDYAKAFDCVGQKKLENSERDGNTRPPDLPLEKPVCRWGSNS